jgi:hypothetical protein
MSAFCSSALFRSLNALFVFYQFMVDAMAKIGNAPIVKALYNVMQGFEDIKQVIGMIAGTVLGPAAKIGVKAVLTYVLDFLRQCIRF